MDASAKHDRHGKMWQTRFPAQHRQDLLVLLALVAGLHQMLAKAPTFT
jgi:hypothetical protein